jgi:hypothetical protein
MPRTNVSFFRDDDGSVPVFDWLEQVRNKNDRAFRKCYALINLLRQSGSELRRPRADYLRATAYTNFVREWVR